MDRRGTGILGVLVLVAIVAGIVWFLDRGEEPLPRDERPALVAAAGTAPPDRIVASPGGPSPEVPPEVSRDLAQRLARVLDGGVRAAPASDPSSQGSFEQLTVQRPAVQLDHPLSAAEQMEYVSRTHDWIILRRDEVRSRLAELQANGEGDSLQAERARRELIRLDQTEPEARRQVEELAARIRAEEERAP